MKGPSVEQKLFGGGNVILREANRIEEFADIVADLGVAFQPSTFPESQKMTTELGNIEIQSTRERERERENLVMALVV